MACIYKIINTCNDKVYIGQTLQSLESRWNSHLVDCRSSSKQHRPLYQAMNELGIENFSIQLIEETDNPNERETFWIHYFNSKNNGYNATLGGQGTVLIDWDNIICEYQSGKSARQIGRETGHDPTWLAKGLKERGIKLRSSRSKPIIQKTLTGDFIAEYSSTVEAAIAINKSTKNHIGDVCNGKRKSAYGFIWEWKT